MAQRIATFDDWKDLFYKWQSDIGFDRALVRDYKFDAIYDEGTGPDIEFGDYKGRKKFAKLLDVPTQDMRDSLLHLIFFQGDTEFGSTEQQRKLIDTAPSDYDRQCLLRVMREEQRHGWQMCHVLINNFGESGKLEARKLLERRAYEGTRLLGAFNKNSTTSSTSSPIPASSTATASTSSPCCTIRVLRRSRAAWGRCSRKKLSICSLAKAVCRASSRPAKCRLRFSRNI